MAYLPTFEDEEQRQQGMSPMAQPALAYPGGAPTSSPGAASEPGGGAAPQPEATPTAGSGPTGFINFGQYLNANRGVADREAGAMTGGLQKDAQSAQAGLGAAQNTFQTGLTAGSPFGVGPKAYANPNAGKGGGFVADSNNGWGAPAQPTSAELRTKSKQTYTGPAGLEGYDDLAKKTSEAQRRVAAGNTQPGRQALVNERYGGSGSYGQGSSGFDERLIGSAGGNRWGQLQQQYGGLTKALQSARDTATQRADTARGYTADQASRYGQQADQLDAANAPKPAAAPIVSKSVGPGGVATSDAEGGSKPPGWSDAKYRDFLSWRGKYGLGWEAPAARSGWEKRWAANNQDDKSESTWGG